MAGQLHVLSVNQTVLRAVVARRGRIWLVLERKCVLVAVVIHVDDRVALRGNRLGSLVCALERESGLTCIRGSGNAPVAGVDRRWRGTGSTTRPHRLDIVVSVAVDVLLPNDDGVVGRRNRRPLCVERRGLRELVAERELAARACGVVIPAAERITKTRGVSRSSCNLTILKELRRSVGNVLAILLEDEPVAIGGLNEKRDAANELELGQVGIHRGCRHGVTVGKRGVLCGRDIPALELLIGGCGRVLHVDGVVGRSGRRHRVDGLGSKNDAVARLVGDIVHVVNQRVVSDLGAFLNASVKLSRYLRADVVDVDAGFHILNGVILFGGPAAEHLSGRNESRAGIVEDGVELAVINVSLLHLHGGNLGIAILEVNG